ncbi:MAG: Helix-turn-helix domain [Actinomycetota bacterium]|nr:Helix-turn-helix domain [Actinomycetota bacterium]
MDDNGTMLNPRQAATRLGVAVRELYRLIDVGDLAAYKVGCDLRLRVEDLDSWGAANSAS